MTISEVYFFNQNDALSGEMNLDFTKLNVNNLFKTKNNLFNIILKNNEEIVIGTLYANKILQTNSSINITNATNTYTLTTKNGIIMFLLAPNYNFLPSGYKSATKPIFKSGNYLDKNIEITIEVLDDILQTRRLSLLYL